MKFTSDYLAKKWLQEGEVFVDLVSDYGDWPSVIVKAKIDTGADRTSVHEDICIALGWATVSSKKVRNANGIKIRNVYWATFVFEGIEYSSEVTASDRSKLSHPMLIGSDILRETLGILEEE